MQKQIEYDASGKAKEVKLNESQFWLIMMAHAVMMVVMVYYFVTSLYAAGGLHGFNTWFILGCFFLPYLLALLHDWESCKLMLQQSPVFLLVMPTMVREGCRSAEPM